MAVKLRLSRIGKTGSPLYRLVAIDEHKKRNGLCIETLGSYNPHQKDNLPDLHLDRVKYWLSVGAKPSDTVRQLLTRLNLLAK